MNKVHRWFCSSDRYERLVRERLLPWSVGKVPLGDHVCEVGSGPGLTTSWLHERVPRVTAIEIDGDLVRSLRRKVPAAGVDVVRADGTRLPLPDASVSAVVCFTMLHHVPTRAGQGRIVAEAHRVLRPGGWFCGSDSRSSRAFRVVHFRDTMNVVDPDDFAVTLAAAGFTDVTVDAVERAFKFRAQR